MVNSYQRVFDTLARQLPVDEDRELLKKLIEIQETKGPDAVTSYLEKTLEDMTGD